MEKSQKPIQTVRLKSASFHRRFHGNQKKQRQPRFSPPSPRARFGGKRVAFSLAAPASLCCHAAARPPLLPPHPSRRRTPSPRRRLLSLLLPCRGPSSPAAAAPRANPLLPLRGALSRRRSTTTRRRRKWRSRAASGAARQQALCEEIRRERE
ncbi:hypothetical protein PVAP13_3NG184582 [Panicum virgatum]|uniref:Uncharacterized protein n=1 Tax=Panicum virgatum TaxID=38727 RepID=A0A8T0U2J7_PANVG|nr:hypothetical protein PVAP13_3NG184582 [Panicum virgatum]